MDKVKSYIEANKERFISELFDLLRIPSISAQSEHKPDMTRCAEWLAAALAKAGADRTEVFPTEGNPVVYAEKIVDPKAKTVLVYGHYDVMPVDPRGEWRTEPFEPVIKDGRIWGRGADDDKGQLWMHAKAFEAMCATESLPCNVKFMLEGEEEIGSPSLYKFCEQNKKMLKADIILVSDTSMISMQTPSITCGLRGLAYMEVEVTGPDKDLHSGLFGGAVLGAKGAITGTVTEVSAADPVDISAAKARFREFEATLTNVTPDCRIVISTSEKRALLDNVVVTCTAITPATKPAAPGGVSFDAAAAADRLTLKWNAVPDATSYTVAYWKGSASAPESEYAYKTGIASTATSQELTNLESNTSYWAKVKAVGSLDSDWSETANATTMDSGGEPLLPTADLLDVVFRNDGSAMDNSSSATPVRRMPSSRP